MSWSVCQGGRLNFRRDQPREADPDEQPSNRRCPTSFAPHSRMPLYEKPVFAAHLRRSVRSRVHVRGYCPPPRRRCSEPRTRLTSSASGAAWRLVSGPMEAARLVRSDGGRGGTCRSRCVSLNCGARPQSASACLVEPCFRHARYGASRRRRRASAPRGRGGSRTRPRWIARLGGSGAQPDAK